VDVTWMYKKEKRKENDISRYVYMNNIKMNARIRKIL
jgi:hypothetical protein